MNQIRPALPLSPCQTHVPYDSLSVKVPQILFNERKEWNATSPITIPHTIIEAPCMFHEGSGKNRNQMKDI